MTVKSTKLYSSLKYLRFQDRLEAIREGRLAAPVHIRIKPINRCNHDCWYCAYRMENLQLGWDMEEKDVLPEAKMFEIVDDCVSMGVKAVTFSGGGEPLLYKPLPEVIDKLAAGGVKVAALTNGSNLKGRVAEAFAEHATWVRISTESWDDESYAKMRRIKVGEFSRVMQNMADFSKLGSQCVLGVSFIVDRENHTHIRDVCARFKDAGANHVSLSGVVVDNEGGKNNEYHAPFRAAAMAEIERTKRDLEDASFSIVNHYHELEERFDKEYNFCPFLQFQTVIGADACVYACHDKAYNEAGLLGSIKERSFKEFWFSEENRARAYGINPSRDCNHHCVAHVRNLSILEFLAINPEHGVFV
jgi:MoaA/NifB/PqqE/SkfB family radical SAM enzyme